MINLLPPREKEILLMEKKKRMVIILWALVLFFLICLILILFSIKIYLQTQVESQKILLLEARKEFEQSEFQNLQEGIKSANFTLGKLNSFYQEKIYFSEILERISKTLPAELYLTDLSAVFSPAEETGVNISLSGFAPTVETLLEFSKNLEKEKGFKDIHFPSEVWFEPFDIDFFVTFRIDNRY